jgi:hypothetical protein
VNAEQPSKQANGNANHEPGQYTDGARSKAENQGIRKHPSRSGKRLWRHRPEAQSVAQVA